MKRIILLLCILHCFTFVYAQSEAPVQTATTAIPNKDAKFLLFPTKNIYNFLKLNTRTGEVSIVQYSLDGKEGEVKIQVHNGTDPIVHCVKGDFYPKQEESIPIPIAAEE